MLKKRIILAAALLWSGMAAAQEPNQSLTLMEQAKEALAAKDYNTALRFYAQEAEAGNARAQAALGILFASGHGIEQNRVQALAWLIRAEKATIDTDPALKQRVAEAIAEMRQKLDPKQVAHAENIAQRWLDGERFGM